MKITETQPLEHATPVVPETQGTADERASSGSDESRAADGRDGVKPAPPGAAEGSSSDAFPEPPTGSAGHP